VVVVVAAGLGASRYLAEADSPLPLAPSPFVLPLAPEAPDAAVALAEPAPAPADAADAGEPALAGLPDAGVVLAAVAGVEPEPEPVRKATRPRKPGRINIVTTHGGDSYWAQVTIDGVARGRTPLLLDLPAGSHQLKVERPGFKPQSREIRVASGKSTVVRIDLSP
jgi:hypothetical protein